MENENFETTDIVLATTLSAVGFQIKGLTATNDGGRYKFVFPMDDRIQDVIKQYEEDKLAIEPKRFAYNYNFLKKKVHQKGGF